MIGFEGDQETPAVDFANGELRGQYGLFEEDMLFLFFILYYFINVQNFYIEGYFLFGA